jgi:undecaprenyl-phosphate 4-deoxy-4-formamido-L-arabinose transferase
MGGNGELHSRQGSGATGEAPPKSQVGYSVVIPLFNDEKSLPGVHERVSTVFRSLGKPYEIIYVDDGSHDGTFEALRAVHHADPTHVKAIRLMRNFGQHPAVTAGFDHVAGQVVITLDSDLQNPPEEIPRLLAKLDEGYDVVTGWRQNRQDSLSRRLPSFFINWIISSSTGVRLHDYGCMLRVYRREVVELLNRCGETTRFITALTSWLGVSIAEVPIRHEARQEGRSRYGFGRLLRMTLDVVTGYSIAPIQTISVMGIIMASVGIVAGLFLLAWRVIFGVNVTGLATFVALLLVLFGVQLAALGIIGEYIGRIYLEVRQRPYYLVRTVIDTSPTEGNE